MTRILWDRHRTTRFGVLTLCLSLAFAGPLNTFGCSKTVPRESSHADHRSDRPATETLATSADVQALTDRLKMLTQEVERSSPLPRLRLQNVRSFAASRSTPRRRVFSPRSAELPPAAFFRTVSSASCTTWRSTRRAWLGWRIPRSCTARSQTMCR